MSDNIIICKYINSIYVNISTVVLNKDPTSKNHSKKWMYYIVIKLIVFHLNWKSENVWRTVSFHHQTTLFLFSFIFVIDILCTNSTFAAVTILLCVSLVPSFSLYIQRSLIHHSNTIFIGAVKFHANTHLYFHNFLIWTK